MPDAESITRSTLKEIPVLWPGDASEEFARHFLVLADFHGVTALLHHLRFSMPDAPVWPAGVESALKESALSRTAWEISHQRAVTRVLEAFRAIGITPLIMKGSALAYSHYPAPAIRARCDTDLLIPRDAREAADQVFSEAGFAKRFGITGNFISNEAAYSRTDGFGFDHTFDVHWKINNAQVFARMFGYDDLLERAVPIPDLDKLAMGLCPADALLLACLHRAGHLGYEKSIGNVTYREGNRLIWIYDIHLLFTGMSVEEQQAFAERALETGLGGVCLDALETCHGYLDTPISDETRAALSRAGDSDPAARYLRAGQLGRFWIELGAYPGWRERLGYLRELAFPPPAYMRQKYADGGSSALLFLYLRRAFGGVRKRVFPKTRSL